MTDVTVIIPTRDRLPLLRRTLATVQRQQRVALEIVVVDDGSTGDTAAAITALGDARIRLLRNNLPQGVNAARNRGIAEAGGRWVAFCDDDDLWAPSKLRAQLDAAEAQEAVWAYGGAVWIDLADQIHGGAPPPAPETLLRDVRRFNAVPAGASNVIVLREVLVATGGMDTHLRYLDDWDLWLRLAAVGRPACVPEPLVAYRLHAVQQSLEVSAVRTETRIVEQRYGIRANRARLHRYFGRSRLRAGQRGRALAHLCLAAVASGFHTEDLRADARLLRQYARGVAQHRLGWTTSRRQLERLDRAAQADPHRAYKAEAEGWLSSLRSAQGS